MQGHFQHLPQIFAQYRVKLGVESFFICSIVPAPAPPLF